MSAVARPPVSHDDTTLGAPPAGAPAGRLALLIWQGDEPRIVTLEPGEAVVLGRGEPADVVVEAPTLSREHVRVTSDGTVVEIRDLESKNGVHVGGARVESARLRSGDAFDAAGVQVLVTALLPDAGAAVPPLSRRALIHAVEGELARHRVTNRPFTVAVIDGRGAADVRARHWLLVRCWTRHTYCHPQDDWQVMINAKGVRPARAPLGSGCESATDGPDVELSPSIGHYRDLKWFCPPCYRKVGSCGPERFREMSRTVYCLHERIADVQHVFVTSDREVDCGRWDEAAAGEGCSAYSDMRYTAVCVAPDEPVPPIPDEPIYHPSGGQGCREGYEPFDACQRGHADHCILPSFRGQYTNTYGGGGGYAPQCPIGYEDVHLAGCFSHGRSVRYCAATNSV